MISPAILLLAAVLHRPPERVHRIYDYAPAHPVLHLAVVEAESEFNFNARHVNPDGSVDEGAYQTNSQWHPRFADADERLAYGAANLEKVIARYPDLRHALGAYNTGNPHKGAVYARRVLAIYQRLIDWLGGEGNMQTGLFAETQNDKVLRLLRERPAGITPGDAMRELGCYRLGARVFDLRRRGYSIKSEMVEVPTRDGKTRVALYRLEDA